MTNEEINRYIHAEIMGQSCHHTVLKTQNGITRCPLCGMEGQADQPYAMQKFEAWRVTDYCSDDSPRRLLNEVAAKVLTSGCGNEYVTGLANDHLIGTSRWSNAYEGWRRILLSPADAVLLVHSTSQQIATACVEAHKALNSEV